jgi:hypothetical protein
VGPAPLKYVLNDARQEGVPRGGGAPGSAPGPGEALDQRQHPLGMRPTRQHIIGQRDALARMSVAWFVVNMVTIMHIDELLHQSPSPESRILSNFSIACWDDEPAK